MTERTESLQSRIEASFLFTQEERESLLLLCGLPEFAHVVAESLSEVLAVEEAAMSALSEKLPKEASALVREIEALESRHERENVHMESVFV